MRVEAELTLHEKTFKLLMAPTEVQIRVKEIACDLIPYLEQAPEPVFIVVLKGAVPYSSDLIRYLPIHIKEKLVVDFIQARSYSGLISTGYVHLGPTPTTNLRDKDIFVIEDIIDTGQTMNVLLALLRGYHPKSIKVCPLFLRRTTNYEFLRNWETYQNNYVILPDNLFVVGYGLDYCNLGRCLPAIYTVEK